MAEWTPHELSRLRRGGRPPPRGRITRVWYALAARDRTRLGIVAWHGPWRRYCFYPERGTIWSADCLADVAAFCERKIAERAAERAKGGA